MLNIPDSQGHAHNRGVSQNVDTEGPTFQNNLEYFINSAPLQFIQEILSLIPFLGTHLTKWRAERLTKHLEYFNETRSNEPLEESRFNEYKKLFEQALQQIKALRQEKNTTYVGDLESKIQKLEAKATKTANVANEALNVANEALIPSSDTTEKQTDLNTLPNITDISSEVSNQPLEGNGQISFITAYLPPEDPAPVADPEVVASAPVSDSTASSSTESHPANTLVGNFSARPIASTARAVTTVAIREKQVPFSNLLISFFNLCRELPIPVAFPPEPQLSLINVPSPKAPAARGRQQIELNAEDKQRLFDFANSMKIDEDQILVGNLLLDQKEFPELAEVVLNKERLPASPGDVQNVGDLFLQYLLSTEGRNFLTLIWTVLNSPSELEYSSTLSLPAPIVESVESPFRFDEKFDIGQTPKTPPTTKRHTVTPVVNGKLRPSSMRGPFGKTQNAWVESPVIQADSPPHAEAEAAPVATSVEQKNTEQNSFSDPRFNPKKPTRRKENGADQSERIFPELNRSKPSPKTPAATAVPESKVSTGAKKRLVLNHEIESFFDTLLGANSPVHSLLGSSLPWRAEGKDVSELKRLSNLDYSTMSKRDIRNVLKRVDSLLVKAQYMHLDLHEKENQVVTQLHKKLNSIMSEHLSPVDSVDSDIKTLFVDIFSDNSPVPDLLEWMRDRLNFTKKMPLDTLEELKATDYASLSSKQVKKKLKDLEELLTLASRRKHEGVRFSQSRDSDILEDLIIRTWKLADRA